LAGETEVLGENLFTPREIAAHTLLMESWMDPRAGQDAVEKRRLAMPGIKFGHSSP
jgi:hypothetical protein